MVHPWEQEKRSVTRMNKNERQAAAVAQVTEPFDNRDASHDEWGRNDTRNRAGGYGSLREHEDWVLLKQLSEGPRLRPHVGP